MTDLLGKCTSCTILYEVNNGVCQLKTCNGGEVLDGKTGMCVSSCGAKQQFIGNRCRNLPKCCLRLAPHLAC